MRKPDEKLKAQRREQLIAVASELFAMKNYHEVLMDEVAVRAGIAKGTVYNYFPTKEDLYKSIITERLESLLRLLQDRIDNRHTPLTNIRRIVVHMYSFMAKYSHFFQIWYKEKLNCTRSPHEHFHKLYQEIKNLMIIALERGIKEDILRPHAAPFVADIAIGIIDSAVLRSENLTAEERKLERVRVYEFILDALGTDLAHQLHRDGQDEPQKEEGSVIVAEK